MRFALSVGRVHTSSVFVMKSSVLIVDSWGKPLRSRTERLTARWKRPFDAMTTRSVRSRSTGFDG